MRSLGNRRRDPEGQLFRFLDVCGSLDRVTLDAGPVKLPTAALQRWADEAGVDLEVSADPG